ncbi:methylenetetrahydrofolate reductase C-terminal domain-containing protein [Aquamicrobium defluvii]|uniref:Methylene-tetrahydrofolate reductase-like protein n=1 Tax=Aquamicrobium defluvii TaxID=69279 RepID=A0A011UVJ1_9HYPH|nr:methylenetetrahydrofolate reductase C-terminal domain-containing protein [Aquamicrobium defluvii]EXL09873.1 methylenetetrahydrofolate reductase [Aquamicrobium defluvii]EZQ16665.1 methylenetetrahydrofolate reductase [Halopseudomonas bauzanensis]TDR38098.1 methylene-tetrahydrofolate reductase-like protein [Aquamicrobium defluvii]
MADTPIKPVPIGAGIPPAATGTTTQAAAVRKNAPKSDYKPADVSPQRRMQRSWSVRLWSVRHSRLLEWVYARLAETFLALHPLWKAIGYGRVEAPVKFVEKRVKGFMFDCRMCGQCILSSTGMSCPMNCPKQLRNGPCGGVRANGNCEVEPDMPCVWVKAWEGSRNMVKGDAILNVQNPVDQSLRETSAWLRVTAQAAAAREQAKTSTDVGAAA